MKYTQTAIKRREYSSHANMYMSEDILVRNCHFNYVYKYCYIIIIFHDWISAN